MTRDEFNKAKFGAGMEAVYCEVRYKVMNINFTEALFGLVDMDDFDDITWVRCESAELV